MTHRLRHLALTASLAALASALPAVAPAQTTPATVTAKPAGWSDQSYYLPMRDGVRLAVSLYFPGGVEPSTPTPVLLIQTRYGRAREMRYGSRWRDAGYVVAIVDTRGSTASFGERMVDIGPEEVRDMDEIIAHLAARPWSNGQVIASGISYAADTADWATSRPAPGLIAAIPRETDFDAYLGLFFPGGVGNSVFLQIWGSRVHEIDEGRDSRDPTLDCKARAEDCPKLFPILQPVDGDEDFTLLRQALKARTRHWKPGDYANLTFRDEPGLNGYDMLSSSPSSDLAGIRAQAKPVQYWGSWLDGGTADAALARFRSAPEVPAEVWITANDHGGDVGSDPFQPDRKTPLPSVDEQFSRHFDFVERVRAGKPVQRTINYYVMGAGVFRKTQVWPPEGVAPMRLHLDADAEMTAGEPRTGVDHYDVDFSVGSGKATRWGAQLGIPAAYPDRREIDGKLLVYDGPAMARDMELAGSPVMTLRLASSSGDPAIIVYLEDVAPDGRVTYLTEGSFRPIHREPADPADLPYDQGPAPHSYKAVDALLVTPGQMMALRFTLQPTAAIIRKGHRIRVAIAGADVDTFDRYPKQGPERFDIERGGATPSSVELPMRPWRP